MNQILSTENHYKQKKSKKNSELIDMRKIIIIFSILIIGFALIIVGAKIYGIIRENKENDKGPVSVLNKPEITIEKAGNICTLTISYDEGLDKILYYWNDEDVREQSMNGFTEPFSVQIIIPEGDYNVLHVKATGVDGSVNEINQEFAVGDVQDPTKPNISWYYNSDTAEIEIVAKSEKGIKNLTYRWEDEEEVIINSTEENQKEIRATIPARRGSNEIYITATDLEGNTQTKHDITQGIYKPKIKVQLINNKTISINIDHDMGFKKVYINVNGQELVYDENYSQYSTEITNLNTSIDVEPGIVNVKISVYTLEETDKEYLFESSVQILQ